MTAETPMVMSNWVSRLLLMLSWSLAISHLTWDILVSVSLGARNTAMLKELTSGLAVYGAAGCLFGALLLFAMSWCLGVFVTAWRTRTTPMVEATERLSYDADTAGLLVRWRTGRPLTGPTSQW